MVRVFICCSLLLTACAGGVLPPEDFDAELEALERETGHPWRARRHEDTGTPALLVGRTAPIERSASALEHAARRFVIAHGMLFGLTQRGDDVDASSAAPDGLGMTHVRLQQERDGVRVEGGTLIAHFSTDGALVQINGRLEPLEEIDAGVRIAADTARAIAEADVRARMHDLIAKVSTQAPERVILPLPVARQCWKVHVELHSPTQPGRYEVYVDAIDGLVRDAIDSLEHLRGYGHGVFGEVRALEIASRNDAFWLEDQARDFSPMKTYSMRNRTRLPGGQVSSSQTARWDDLGEGAGAAVDAHAFTALSFDYFAREHGRRGWSAAVAVHTAVHFGERYTNAFFDGRTIVFGDGDERTFSPLAAAPDIVAHEYTHAVIRHSAALVPRGESGALDEAIADLFAVLIEADSTGNCDWQIGERVYHPSGWPEPLRDLAHPARTRNASHLAEQIRAVEDNGAVHVNSTIASHAAYLMAEGGTHARSQITVEPIGRALTARIWYRALDHYLPANADFRAAAEATSSAARDLAPEARSSVEQAWRAVGVAIESW